MFRSNKENADWKPVSNQQQALLESIVRATREGEYTPQMIEWANKAAERYFANQGDEDSTPE